ncbi:flagellar motor switch protein FliN [Zhongshania sp.]|jgi:flagellar motor switch protein FliN/FliY|uniref:flagellar motor switch protein FliN n=1 Tax=Zhongshania sp. TaxID=1971902 RepID=UPI001B49BCEF|nr:flagellar motor switch protein FliN [Zhongshania sp.]MBQ0796014.1 flagellar motor switch protein FliN [Zhongshania sp.]|tara:strand:+ start:3330 stop:3749 length:420 start_codon:yes stop_codon:yes gene_type:complete
MDKQDELRRQRQNLKEEMEAADRAGIQHASSAGRKGQVEVDGPAARLRDRKSPGPDLSMVMDIPVRLTLEVGGSDMPIRDLLQLHQGAIVELDRMAGEPLDVMANGTLIARGEVVVIEDKLGIRLTEVVSQAERLQSLR